MKPLGGKLTLCLWMQSTEPQGTLFSYALSIAKSNEVLLDYSTSGFTLMVAGEGRTYSFFANDGKWHHICASWCATGGLWKMYKDGVLQKLGTGFQTGHQIEGGGVLVLGQDQDRLGGGFDAVQSFKGLLTNYNLWNDELSDTEIEQLSKSCRAGEGTALKWSDFLNSAVRVKALIPVPSLCRV
ncbi:neuronal pentraxin-1-like [Oculina patagonica]